MKLQLFFSSLKFPMPVVFIYPPWKVCHEGSHFYIPIYVTPSQNRQPYVKYREVLINNKQKKLDA